MDREKETEGGLILTMHLKMKEGEEEEKTAIGPGMVCETFIA